MRNEDVQVIRSLFAALEQRDLDTVRLLLHDEFFFAPSAASVSAPVYRGRRAVDRWAARLDELFGSWRIELERVIVTTADCAVVAVRNVRPLAEGRPAGEQRYYVTCHVRGGRLHSAVAHASEAEAREPDATTG